MPRLPYEGTLQKLGDDNCRHPIHCAPPSPQSALWGFAGRPQGCGGALSVRGDFPPRVLRPVSVAHFQMSGRAQRSAGWSVRRSTLIGEDRKCRSSLAARTTWPEAAYTSFRIATRDRSDDAELLLLLGPAMRQRAGERGETLSGSWSRRERGKRERRGSPLTSIKSCPARR
jgi:hypothetical protein